MSVLLTGKPYVVCRLPFSTVVVISPMPVGVVTLKVISGFAGGVCGLVAEELSRERKQEKFWGKESDVIGTKILALLMPSAL